MTKTGVTCTAGGALSTCTPRVSVKSSGAVIVISSTASSTAIAAGLLSTPSPDEFELGVLCEPVFVDFSVSSKVISASITTLPAMT